MPYEHCSADSPCSTYQHIHSTLHVSVYVHDLMLWLWQYVLKPSHSFAKLKSVIPELAKRNERDIKSPPIVGCELSKEFAINHVNPPVTMVTNT